MGLSDRDYQRREDYEGDGRFSQFTPIVKWLLILNIGVFLLDLFLANGSSNSPIKEFGAFTIQSGLFEFQLWEFFTFQFIHASLGHLVFNCLGLYFFGHWLERWWGSSRFFLFYLGCGAGGALFYSLLVILRVLSEDHFMVGLVGASAGIYGILAGVAVIAPDLRVQLLFPPIQLSMRQMAIGLMVISAGSIVFRLGGNEGGEASHIGGALLGYLFIRYPVLITFPAFATMAFWHRIHHKPGSTQTSKPNPRVLRKRDELDRVDTILDKISQHGFQSLTVEERKFLEDVSKSKRLPE